MTDLRTRLAAVLYEDGQRPMHTASRLADAVIRELQLTVVGDAVIVGCIHE